MRGVPVVLLLVACSLFSAGCAADTRDDPGPTPPIDRTFIPSTPYPGENQTYAYARSLVPEEIPGFVLQSRAKEPLTIWEDPYHFHSYWTPANASTFNGSVQSLSVDVFVYDELADALAWLDAFEADSDGLVTIEGVNASYRFRGGVAEIAFMTDTIIVYSSAVAERERAESGQEAARHAAVIGAERAIQRMP